MAKKGMLILWSVCVAVILFALQARGQTAAELREVLSKLEAYPDTVVVNGKIATMDEKMTTVQAMAVRNKRIIALGTDNEIRKLAGPQTQVMDVKGRTVLPGLIDSHTHPHLWGIEHFGHLYDPQLKITYLMGNTADEIFAQIEPAVRKRAQELGPGKWIILHYQVKLQREMQRRIRREDLDKIGVDNPVFLACALSGITNTKGK